MYLANSFKSELDTLWSFLILLLDAQWSYVSIEIKKGLSIFFY